jgi:hypothetical protein
MVYRQAEAAEVRRLHAAIAAALARGRALTDPEVIAASRRLDQVALTAMRRGLRSAGVKVGAARRP